MPRQRRTIASMAVPIPPGGFAVDRVQIRPADVAEYPGLPLEWFFPTDRARGPLESSTPAPLPVRASVSSMLQLPSAVLGGAMGALLDQPVEAGLSERMSAAAAGAGREMARAPFQDQPTSPSQEAARRGVDELEGLPGLLFDVLSDPANLVGGDPVSDLGKLAIAGAGMTPRTASALGRLYSRVAEDVLPRLSKSQHANRVRSVLKSFASADEVTTLGLEDFLAKKGNEPVTLEEVEQLVRDNQLQMRETVLGTDPKTAGIGEELTRRQQQVDRQLAPIRVWAEQLPEETPLRDVLQHIQSDRPGVLLREDGQWDTVIDEFTSGGDEPLFIYESGGRGASHPGDSVARRFRNLVTGEVIEENDYQFLPVVTPQIHRMFPGAKTIRDLARNVGRLLEEADAIEMQQMDLEGGYVERLAGAPRYERYTLPGEKRDYRELLIQMPEEKPKIPLRVTPERQAEARAITDKILRHYEGRPRGPGFSHIREPLDAENFHKQTAVLSEDFLIRSLDKWEADGAITSDEWDTLQRWWEADSRDAADLARAKRTRYKSPHWQEPDIVTHARYDVRRVGDGDALFVEEIQSDWDQAAREKGYALPPEERNRLSAAHDKAVEELNELGRQIVLADPLKLYAKDWDAPALNELARTGYQKPQETWPPELRAFAKKDAEVKNLHEQYIRAATGVADQPFKGTKATELGVKRMLLEAADRGLDQVAWTTGRQQAERYGKLLRDIHRVEFRPPGNGRAGALTVVQAGGSRRVIEDVSPQTLKDYIGKENAERLLKSRFEAPYRVSQFLDPRGFADDGRASEQTIERLSANYGNLDEFIDEDTGQILKPAFTVLPENSGYAADRAFWRNDDMESPMRRLYASEEEARKAVTEWAQRDFPEQYAIDTSREPLTIGSRGMDQQYDEVMVAQFNKLGKPYGARAEKVPLEAPSGYRGVFERAGVAPYDVETDEVMLPLRGIHSDDPTTGKFRIDLGDDDEAARFFEALDSGDDETIYPISHFFDRRINRSYETEADARRALKELQIKARELWPSASTTEVWRFKIPEKMRDDLLTRGLPLMAMAPLADPNQDLSAEDKAKLLGLGALAVVLRGKFGKDPAMLRMVEELAKKPADLSRAARKAGLAGTVEENAIALFRQRGHTDSVSGMAQAMKDAGIALPSKTAAERAAAHAYVREMLARAASKMEPESSFLAQAETNAAAREGVVKKMDEIAGAPQPRSGNLLADTRAELYVDSYDVDEADLDNMLEGADKGWRVQVGNLTAEQVKRLKSVYGAEALLTTIYPTQKAAETALKNFLTNIGA